MYNKLKFFLVAFVIIFLSLNASASTFRIFMQDIVIPEECVLKLNAHFAKEQKVSFICNELTDSACWINIKTQSKDDEPSKESRTIFACSSFTVAFKPPRPLICVQRADKPLPL